MLNLKSLPCFIICVGAVFALSSDALAQGIYSGGHGDIGVAYEDGALDIHWHIAGGTVDGTSRPNEEFEADELIAVTSLTFNAPDGRPAGSAWDPIGNSAGDDVWYMPQTEDAGTPFLGLATEELDPNDWTGDVIWSVTAVSGPGEFSIWQDGVSPSFLASSVDGFDDNDQWTQIVGGHAHANYGFTALGDYDVTFQIDGTHNVDGDLSDTATLSFRVVAVPEPGSLAILGSISVVGLLVRRRRIL